MYSATIKAIATGSLRLIPDVKKSASSPAEFSSDSCPVSMLLVSCTCQDDKGGQIAG